MSPPIAERYCMKSPIIALLFQDGRYVTLVVPASAVVAVDSNAFIGNKLVGVSWDEKKLMMFAQDIRACGEKMDSEEGSALKATSPAPT
jgi:hypothetical protein